MSTKTNEIAKPSTVRRVAVVAVAAATGIVCSTAPAAAMGERRVTVTNSTSIGPETTTPVGQKCPSGAQYLVGLSFEGSGQGVGPVDPNDPRKERTTNETKIKIEGVTFANYPESSSITFSNSSKHDEKPVVKVSGKITLECSNVNPGKFPEKISISTIGYTTEYDRDLNGMWTWVRSWCPAGTHIDDGGYALYDHDKVRAWPWDSTSTDREWKMRYAGDPGQMVVQIIECVKD
ncbi:hypothetical protein GCM10010517_75610 [Streptosporangium fragile]|uniref:Secreted protein n=1 Tax=Streptosporangium fragile TaxID=46186 RepID=A0ABN3WBB3_9ACTN